MEPENTEVSDWLFYASEDLAYGKLGYKDLPRVAAWSFQQSSEKALKALCLHNHNEFPRTHDVAYLLTELSKNHDVPESVRSAVLELSEITPAVRYPSDDQSAITVEEAESYANAAGLVYQWVAQCLK